MTRLQRRLSMLVLALAASLVLAACVKPGSNPPSAADHTRHNMGGMNDKMGGGSM